MRDMTDVFAAGRIILDNWLLQFNSFAIIATLSNINLTADVTTKFKAFYIRFKHSSQATVMLDKIVNIKREISLEAVVQKRKCFS
jgi:hypothetical protein